MGFESNQRAVLGDVLQRLGVVFHLLTLLSASWQRRSRHKRWKLHIRKVSDPSSAVWAFSKKFPFASSFFPTAMQPVINLLVNPIYKVSLSIGLVKHQPIIPLNHSSSSDLRSLTMSISPQDQQDNERRRAIALKALNERWKALNADPSKSQLPKSFPQPSAAAGKQPMHQHHQGGFSHHGHSHERKVIPKFSIDEIMKPIPLPPPPGMMPSDASATLGTAEHDSSSHDW